MAWVAPEAFLNIVYKPAPPELLSRVAGKWQFPLTVVDFLGQQNGAMLFSGSLNLYGVVEPGTLLNRQDLSSRLPFNIEDENSSWTFHQDRLLVVGGYRFDGSRACIDRLNGQIHVFKKKERIPVASWPSLDNWLMDEIRRLRLLFADNGRRTGPESGTGPPSSSIPQ